MPRVIKIENPNDEMDEMYFETPRGAADYIEEFMEIWMGEDVTPLTVMVVVKSESELAEMVDMS